MSCDNSLAYELRLLPDVRQQLGTARSVGSIVLDERSGLPWKANHFSRTLQKIARSCGRPGVVCNIDSRAGAITEGFAAGAEPTDMMPTATQTPLPTTLLYNRDWIGPTSLDPQAAREEPSASWRGLMEVLRRERHRHGYRNTDRNTVRTAELRVRG
ncbi:MULTISPECIES: hypothetical protein [Methylorubrum]|uniref:hypothetical protein n=1 Tax=Methylorubrum TaxID=2282523 RepID=UPI00209FD2DD|nr:MULTISPECIES: hypothetical protein [Methylorubrum]MCP1548490.1 hypothetical protein [Methylorubrum zatmanii]MCP1554895.1 hypothetical protein [Methylorubrum extorquens]MCP1578793.1 hypothetical protein [Methylorubrum extorquens]